MKRVIPCALIALTFSWAALGATDTVLLLHTNDLHGNARVRHGGQGGMPFVAAYAKKMRAERPDVLFLDGGDWTEKGDLFTEKNRCEAGFEAIGRLKYDACVPGNHDFPWGMEKLRQRAVEYGIPMLLLNALDGSGKPIFAGSRIIDVDGVKVGVIGLSINYKDTKSRFHSHVVDVEDTKPLLAAEAKRLAPDADLLVVTAHLNSRSCRILAEAVPEIAVFVSGHSHELIEEPYVAEPSGALIVQAGGGAAFLGELALTVDTEANRIVGHEYKLVRMNPDTIAPDPGFLAWIKERESQVAPEAAKVIARADSVVDRVDVARLCAEAYRLKQGDAFTCGCCAPGNLMDALPEGNVDVNAVFRLTRAYEQEMATFPVTGKTIASLRESIPPATLRWSCPGKIDPEATYMVVIRMRDWERIIERRVKDALGANAPKPLPADFKAMQAIVEYLESTGGESLNSLLKELGSAQPTAEAAA